ncbi:MAG: Acetylxylan esterase precursor, partial [Verrucomicrobiota bacterium]
KATDQRPALVFFHGGSWTGGEPSQLAPQSTYLASRGMVCISAQYRLLSSGVSSGSELPACCEQDAKSAFRWVRAHAAELGIDPARLGVGGGSAGGYLAACVALVPGSDDAADDLKVQLKPAALVLFNPVIGGRPAEVADATFERRFGPKQAEFLAHSPANHVTGDAPPTVIFHGAADTVIPPVQIRRFAESMTAVGARCEVHFYEGMGHGFFNRGKSQNCFSETVITADRFLASLGWLQGEPVPANLPVFGPRKIP